ncbi:PLD nuclease N-terminal domain-containing protein [Brachybacterium sp. DNPG3]
MLRALAAVVSLGLTIFALADCIQTEDRVVRGIPRWAWIVLIVLIPLAGPLTWLLVGKDRSGGEPRRGGPGGGDGGWGGGWGGGYGGDQGGRPGRSPRRSGPLAPDEDPDFLRQLDADIRRERRERDRQEREDRGTDEQADG